MLPVADWDANIDDWSVGYISAAQVGTLVEGFGVKKDKNRQQEGVVWRRRMSQGTRVGSNVIQGPSLTFVQRYGMALRLGPIMNHAV